MYIFWAGIGILFLILDRLKRKEIFLVLATAFLLQSAISYKFVLMSFKQIISAFVVFFVCYFLIHNAFKKEKEDFLKKENLDDFINKKALVIKDIGKTISIDGLGLIEYKENLYSAKSVDDKEIKAGCEVKIVSSENLIMNVEKI